MIIIYLYLSFVFMFLGSFLNVVALRIPNNESIAYPPSHCTSCNHRLSVLDLFPVFSYLFLLGKCRYCKIRISWIYPFGELLTLTTLLIVTLTIGFKLELIVAIPFFMMMIAITLSDIKYKIIPDKVIFPSIITFFVLRIFIGDLPFWNYVVAGLLGGLLLLLIAIVSKGGMGGGDVKLYVVIGLVLGIKLMLLSFFFAVTFGAIIGLALILLKIVKRKQPIPFAPFIFLGTLISYLWGDTIWQAYINIVM